MSSDFSDLALRAEELARNVLLSSAAHQRYWKTEKIWYYRPYQNGDPVQTVDWRQSARTERLLVRGTEPVRFRQIFVWTPLAEKETEAGRRALLLLMATSHMLLKAERTVGWLEEDLRQTRTLSIMRTFFADAVALSRKKDFPPLAQTLQKAVLVLAGNMAQAPESWIDSLRSHGARGNKGVFLDFSSTDSSVAHSLARTMGWPVVRLAPEEAPEKALLHLFEEALKGSA